MYIFLIGYKLKWCFVINWKSILMPGGNRHMEVLLVIIAKSLTGGLEEE